jgi:hypothetical protein
MQGLDIRRFDLSLSKGAHVLAELSNFFFVLFVLRPNIFFPARHPSLVTRHY